MMTIHNRDQEIYSQESNDTLSQASYSDRNEFEYHEFVFYKNYLNAAFQDFSQIRKLRLMKMIKEYEIEEDQDVEMDEEEEAVENDEEDGDDEEQEEEDEEEENEDEEDDMEHEDEDYDEDENFIMNTRQLSLLKNVFDLLFESELDMTRLDVLKIISQLEKPIPDEEE